MSQNIPKLADLLQTMQDRGHASHQHAKAAKLAIVVQEGLLDLDMMKAQCDVRIVDE